ncbi:MAG: UvrB/UvrC motif-containing protein, partial [Acetobacter sp.]
TIAGLEKRMRDAAAELEFETAGRLRDEIKRLEALQLGLDVPPASPATKAGMGRRGAGKEPVPRPLGPGGGGYEPKPGKGRSKRRS